MFHPELHNAMELETLVQQKGFLPFFHCSIPQFSIEEFTPGQYWFVDALDESVKAVTSPDRRLVRSFRNRYRGQSNIFLPLEQLYRALPLRCHTPMTAISVPAILLLWMWIKIKSFGEGSCVFTHGCKDG